MISLTEHPLPKVWIDEAGLLSVHIPIPDMQPPTLEQFSQAVDTIRSAVDNNMGVAVHCFAGKGRTGTVLAAWQIANGNAVEEAVRHIRRLRPGSIETEAQIEALREYAESLGQTDHD